MTKKINKDVSKWTLTDYRLYLGQLMRNAGGPKDVIEEIEFLGYEGGGIFGAIWDSWTTVEHYIKTANDATLLQKRERTAILRDDIACLVHDTVIDIIDARNNWLNNAPGTPVLDIDVEALAYDCSELAWGQKVAKRPTLEQALKAQEARLKKKTKFQLWELVARWNERQQKWSTQLVIDDNATKAYLISELLRRKPKLTYYGTNGFLAFLKATV